MLSRSWAKNTLVVLPGGGLIIDTPGMRELGLWDADAGEILMYSAKDARRNENLRVNPKVAFHFSGSVFSSLSWPSMTHDPTLKSR